MPRFSRCLLNVSSLVCLFANHPAARAYDPPVDKAGPLTAELTGPESVSEVDVPIALTLKLTNASDQLLAGTVRLNVIDRWQIVGKNPRPFKVPPRASTTIPLQVIVGQGTHNALYPIHAVVASQSPSPSLVAHPILIMEVRNVPVPHGSSVARPVLAWRPIALDRDSILSLWQLPLRRVVVQDFDGPSITLPVGFEGSEAVTHASLAVRSQTLDGDQRDAIAMHPPWYGGHAGTMLVEFPLELPADATVQLTFANAMNPGGESDGVTHRVRVARGDAPAGELGETVFERHTTAYTWQPARVDLSRFAGRTVRLQLECHPGPERNTGWDLSFWGRPTLHIGEPKAKQGPDRSSTTPLTLGTLSSGGQTYLAEVVPGVRGLLDMQLRIGNDRQRLSAHGLHVRAAGFRLDDPGSPARLTRIEMSREPSGEVLCRHFFDSPRGTFTLVVRLSVEQTAIGMACRLENVPAARPWMDVHLEDVAVGQWDLPLERVYAGTGNVVDHPGPFQLSFDGHRLSTSFVGYEFAPGLALVEAADVPPTRLDVQPAAKHASLHVSGSQRRQWIPAPTVWQAVKQWRSTNGLRAAAGVEKLAGRFVFDLWGGKYGSSRADLQRAFRYGLTDSAVVWHNWQRWGYDYRLPEIFPPNPKLGTTDELRRMIDDCRAKGVPLALHDNYIDFYPDARGFSYDKVIAFGQDGTPVRAWLNKGRQAQSYRYRPDRVESFLQANLRQIRDQLAPTAYFIDVWSSIRPYEYWTSKGEFHTAQSTRDIWRESFAWIRDFLGDRAPQISESGHDQLIGWLDGAQANHLRVGTPLEGDYGWAVWNWPCRDAERIPWFDAAHHDRFILHGAGYESRYCSGLDRRMHGIYSDDYLTTEMMTGHPAMVSRPFGRDVVRKYWLTQETSRALAQRRIEDVEFVEDDIHRQLIRWSDRGQVWINRSDQDWSVAGCLLPPYGYRAEIETEKGKIVSSIERREGLVVESAWSKQQVYVNARGRLERRLPVRVEVAEIKNLADGKIELALHWQASVPLPEGWHPFFHFCDSDGAIAFQATPPTPADHRVADGVTTRIIATLPESALEGVEYEFCFGFYHPKTGQRLALTGPDRGDRRTRVGSIQIRKDLDQPAQAVWKPFQAAADPYRARYNPNRRSVPFGPITTSGGCRMTVVNNRLELTPLPETVPGQTSFDLNWSELPWDLPRPQHVVLIDDQGAEVDRYDLAPGEDKVHIVVRDNIFAYRLLP